MQLKSSPYPESIDSIARATVKNTAWNYGTFVLSKSVIFFSTVILARILSPDDFGLLALASITVIYLDQLSDLGISSALIFDQKHAERSPNVGFLLSMIVGTLLTLITFFSAPLIAEFFHEPRISPVLRVLSLYFVLYALSSVHQTLLQKQLKFSKRFFPELGKTIVKAVVSIAMALTGFGVWSLVWGQVTGQAAASLLYWNASRWRPRFEYDSKIARSLLRYGSQITIVGVLAVVYKNIDYVIVGRRLGIQQLGFYTMGFRLPELIIISMCSIVGQAIFPAYAKLQTNQEALRSGYLATTRYMAFFSVPVGFLLFLLAPEFIHVFYTPRWNNTVPVLRAISLYSIFFSLSFNVGDIYKATGRPVILNYLALFKLVITVPVLWVASSFGIYYVALGHLATIIVISAVQIAVGTRILRAPLSAILTTLAPPFISGAVMLTAVYLLQRLIAHLSPAERLVILAPFGALIYLASIYLSDKNLMEGPLRLFRLRLRVRIDKLFQLVTTKD